MDFLPGEERLRSEIVKTASLIAKFYGFDRIKTSPVESGAAYAPLVREGLLEERPPVFVKTRAGEELLLIPSGILGVLRAYFSHRLQAMPHPLKMSFEADTFSLYVAKEGYLADRLTSEDAGERSEAVPVIPRREWGLVMIGEGSAVAETEVIQGIWKACAELGMAGEEVEIRINASGCTQCRPTFRASLASFFRSRAGRLCAKSKRDVRRAPARILSCADERCRGISGSAPQALDFLCDRCKKQLRSTLEFLDEVRIPYFLDSLLFRDGSWYGETIFVLLLRQAPEPAVGDAAPADAPLVLIAEGGRVSRAAELLGGKDVSAFGGVLFADAVARVLAGKAGSGAADAHVFFVQLGDLAKRKSFEILEALREGGIEARESLGRDSIKVQLKIAERVGARYALVLGQKEALDGTIMVREVQSGIQETIPQAKLVEFLKKKLKK